MINDLNPYILYCINTATDTKQKAKYNSEKTRVCTWYELLLVTNGEGYVKHNDDCVFAKKSYVFLRSPGTVVSESSSISSILVVFDQYNEKNKTDFYAKYSSPEIINFPHEYTPFEEKNEPFSDYFLTKKFELVHQLFVEIHQKFRYDDLNRQFYYKSRLLFLVSMLYEERAISRNALKTKSFNINREKVDIIKDYILDNINKNFTLSELARKVDLSSEFLCRIFKKYEKQTITQFTNYNRVMKAKKLLSETDMTINQIVYETGFNNQNNFYIVFKKYANMTPAEYKLYHNS
ncbi:MAG: AraC family transcriptional regulator [Clostridia bacterium]